MKKLLPLVGLGLALAVLPGCRWLPGMWDRPLAGTAATSACDPCAAGSGWSSGSSGGWSTSYPSYDPLGPPSTELLPGPPQVEILPSG